MNNIPENIFNYVSNFGNENNNIINQLIRETAITQVNNAQMASDLYQARILEWIVKITNAKKILEIGTFTGVATIAMAMALPNNANITTIEINDEIEWLAKKYFKLSKQENKITQIIGNALDIIPNLNENFDIIFIDADKSQYIEYYNLSLKKLSKNGLIIVDNVLWYNKILEPQKFKDKKAIAISNFLKLVENDISVEKIILPFRDGLLLLKKID